MTSPAIGDALPFLLVVAAFAATLGRRVDGATLCRSGDLTVDSDFPGGNGFIHKIEGDRVSLQQDLRDIVLQVLPEIGIVLERNTH